MVFHRTSEAPSQPHRELALDWQARLAASGLPLAGGGRGRQPLTFGAALPVGMAAERELADIVLVERLPAWRVRGALTADLPPGIVVDGIADVWLGEPPLAATVAAADYRVTLEDAGWDAGEAIAAAAASLLASSSIRWQRARGGGTAEVDLRPLVSAIGLIGDAPIRLRIRALIHPERGTGRPDEVVGALGERVGRTLAVATIVRERVLLADELGGSFGPV
jgi:radical SAM-linked protein